MHPVPQRILCIDNNASSNLAVYLLERAGYEVVTRGSIAEAADLTQDEHFDLHLLNHKLVELEIDSCDKLQNFPARTPILFYTTVSYPYQQIQEIHCRSHGHLLKPINVCDVANQVFRLLKNDAAIADQTLSQATKTKTAATLHG